MAVTLSGAAGGEPAVAVQPGNRRRVSVILAGDSSYPTGGSSLSGVAASLGFTAIDAVSVGLNRAGTHLYVYDSSTGKLLGFSALSTEIANTTDVSAHRIPVVIWGI